ncbi:sigma 54-interacting transcriptional regulator [Thermoanaerobacterium sp. DL9XJH110]|uniref:sigma 54-interacting transcriptional regulator n=1 Tax=Thermoanaerobacterium sp. DL9XJH110 TaxID=3386643 RepID=UPI003BB6BA4F
MNADYLMDIRVRDALKKEVFLVPHDTDVEKLNEIMLLKNQDEVLVIDDDKKIVGIITRNDLAKNLARGIDRKTEVKYIMTPNVVFMPPDKPLLEARSEMRTLGIGRAPVLDEEGNLMGLLTARSICDGFSGQLEKAVDFQKLILDNLKTAVCIINDSCEILYYNRAFEELFKPSKLVKLSPSKFLPAELVDKIKKGEHPLEDIYFESKDNRKFTLKTCRFKFDQRLSGIILSIEEITNVVSLLAELDKTSHKLMYLEKQLNSLKDQECCFGKLVTKNPGMIKAIELAKKIAPTQAPILIRGESGTGKELLANAVHENSDRKNYPLIKVNCAAIPPNLFESELFGYEEGAFTGASRYGKTGLLELADKGTLFLDEIGELPLEQQAKLLRFLQDQTFYKVGGTRPIHVNVRIITATNRDLAALIHEGKFREDLYYRINVITIEIPPLRQRPEDIVPLVNTFIREYETYYDKKINHIDPRVLKTFMDYGWPGNVRELKNVVERMVILSENGQITEEILPRYLKEDEMGIEPIGELNDLDKAANIAEKRVILDTLKKYAYNKTKTARALKISRSTLYNKLRQYNLEK